MTTDFWFELSYDCEMACHIAQALQNLNMLFLIIAMVTVVFSYQQFHGNLIIVIISLWWGMNILLSGNVLFNIAFTKF